MDKASPLEPKALEKSLTHNGETLVIGEPVGSHNQKIFITPLPLFSKKNEGVGALDYVGPVTTNVSDKLHSGFLANLANVSYHCVESIV